MFLLRYTYPVDCFFIYLFLFTYHVDRFLIYVIIELNFSLLGRESSWYIGRNLYCISQYLYCCKLLSYFYTGINHSRHNGTISVKAIFTFLSITSLSSLIQRIWLKSKCCFGAYRIMRLILIDINLLQCLICRFCKEGCLLPVCN